MKKRVSMMVETKQLDEIDNAATKIGSSTRADFIRQATMKRVYEVLDR